MLTPTSYALLSPKVALANDPPLDSIRVPDLTDDPHSSTLVPRTDPSPYLIEDYFDFLTFAAPSPDHKNAVIRALLGASSMTYEAFLTLGHYGTPESTNPPANNPSFLRYFSASDLKDVGAVLQSLLIVLGAPTFEKLRCTFSVPLPKMAIFYAEHPADPGVCEARDLWAYVDERADQFGVTRGYMVLCRSFFEQYKSYDAVRCEDLVDVSIDPGYADEADVPVWSSSLVVLHELLHWRQLTMGVVNRHIRDIELTRPAPDNRQTEALRAFFATKLKEGAFGAQVGPTYNDDNYVFTVAEIYYGKKCPEKLPWADPPDHQLAFGPSGEEDDDDW